MLYLKLVLTAVFWGGTFVAGRIVAREMGPFSAAFLRFAVASVFLLGIVLKSCGRIPPLDRKHILPILVLGLTGVFGYNAFFFSGLKLITASRASLIIASQPAFIALLSSYFFKEKLNFLKIQGIILSIAGAMVVISHGHPLDMFRNSIGTGELYILGCVSNWVVYSLVGKVAMKRLSPLLTVAYACVVGTVFLFPPALLEGIIQNIPRFSRTAWLAVLFLALFGTVLGFIWYYNGIRDIGPARAGIFINFVPVSSVVLAYFILGETVDFSLILGAALVISGVYLTNRSPSAPPGAVPLADPSCRH